jgi:riboflavin synthase
MFSGIVEAVVPVLKEERGSGVLRIHVQRPIEFDDIKTGDSICTNGVCLTVESFSSSELIFALAAETLKILGLNNSTSTMLNRKLNLERSLRFGDRIHGHLVSGHVESLGKVVKREVQGESLFLDVEVQDSVLPFLWNKGSITMNGTSLTVNGVIGKTINVCLIPETQKRTNLGELNVGETLTIEPDYMARATVQAAIQAAMQAAVQSTMQKINGAET